MKQVILILALILVLPVSGQAASYRDALGRTVELPAPAERILSLVPAVTEILFTLNLQDRIVAATDSCDYPPAAGQLPKVGEYANPGIENILLFKPDLVFASAGMNSPNLVKRLETLGIPVYVVYSHSVAETLKTISAIGELTARQNEAAAAVREITGRLDWISGKLAQRPKPSVLTCIMLQPLTVAGPDTFIDDIISHAGGINIVAAGPSRYPTWGKEALLTLNPDAIIVSSYPGQPDPLTFFNQWPQLQAVRDRRIAHIEADWLHRPGPRMVLGIEAMARALHPDVDFDE